MTKIVRTIIACVLGSFVLLPASAHAQVKVFPKSQSPKRTYSIGWSTNTSDVTTNYVVRTKGNAVVKVVAGCAHFPGENHGTLKVAWAPNERMVALVHGGKWQPQGVYVVSVLKGAEPSQLSILSRLDRDAKALTKRKAPRVARTLGDEAVTDVVSVKFRNVKTLEVQFSRSKPKDETGKSFEGVLRYKVTTTPRGLSMKLSSGTGRAK